jgi:hypothetical protein
MFDVPAMLPLIQMMTMVPMAMPLTFQQLIHHLHLMLLPHQLHQLFHLVEHRQLQLRDQLHLVRMMAN